MNELTRLIESPLHLEVMLGLLLILVLTFVFAGAVYLSVRGARWLLLRR